MTPTVTSPAFHRTHKSSITATCAVWGVGYVLVICMTLATGSGRLPWDLVLYGPMWASGVGLSIGLLAIWRALGRLHPAARWVITGAAALIAAVIQTAFDASMMITIQRLLPEDPAYSRAMDLLRLARLLILYAWTFCLTVALFWAVARERDAVEAEQRAREAERLRREAEFQALRLQLNPHFLFNSLNGVSTLILDGRTVEADAMLMKTAHFLRAIMNADPRALETIAAQMAVIEAYLQVEAMRFGERLSWVVDCDQAALDQQAPALLLQPLVENAVKHAVAVSERPVKITIEARLDAGRLRLTVRDDGQGARAAAYGAGIGLRNVASRLSSYYGSRAAFDASAGPHGYSATIDLPAE